MISPIDRVTYVIPVVAGQAVADKLCQLVSRTVAIRGVTVDNQNSDLTVLIFAGTSPNGIPYPVLPGKSISIAIDGPFGAYLRFIGIPAKSGVIYASVSAAANELFNSSTVSIDNAVTIDGIVPVAIQGAVPIAAPVHPPPGSLPVNFNERLSLTTASEQIELSPGPAPGSGWPHYTVFIAMRGFNRQPYVNWRFRTRRAVDDYHAIFAGWGDERLVLPLPYLYTGAPAAVQGVFFGIVNPDSIRGTLEAYVTYAGYYAAP
jgi:hypothetical protein